ncbi:stress response protein NST1-like [Acanthaster planci]|uniref:Stress response protein NST1-like n=1 Tax=Acanthaster planci TaxID=133434 RepID=A0A8B7ZC76_ACAPL|nr:stress response protein NST1-like [Acanthaster planci]
MGGCNQSKVVPASSPANEFSTGMVKNKSLSFWKFLKNRHNMIRVAPALPEDQLTTDVSDRTIVGINKPPSPIHPRLRKSHDDSPSLTFSEVSLSPYMITEDTADGDELLEVEIAGRPPTPDLYILGTPLFAKKISNKKKLHARQESQEILRELRNAGIVARQETRTGGVAYEYFVKEKFGLLKKPPARLEKLKKAKKMREARGDAKLREEMESRMQMAEERRKNVLDKVRIQQTQHLVLDIRRARDNSAALEEEKIQATAERLQQKEILSQVMQGRATVNRGLRNMQKKHHHTEVRLRAALKKMAKKDEELREAREIIVVSPMRGVEQDQDQSEEEEMAAEHICN